MKTKLKKKAQFKMSPVIKQQRHDSSEQRRRVTMTLGDQMFSQVEKLAKKQGQSLNRMLTHIITYGLGYYS